MKIRSILICCLFVVSNIYANDELVVKPVFNVLDLGPLQEYTKKDGTKYSIKTGVARELIRSIHEEIEAVTVGGRIRFTTFRFDNVTDSNDYELKDVLTDAANRGVTIEAVIDGNKSNSHLRYIDPDWLWLKPDDLPSKYDYVIDYDVQSPIHIYGCTGNSNIFPIPETLVGGCASAGRSDDKIGIQHNKFMLLEYVHNGERIKKVLQTSSNFSDQTSVKLYQDLLIIENDDLFEIYSDRYQLLKGVKDVGISESYKHTELSAGDASYNVHFLPINSDDYDEVGDGTLTYDDVDPVAKVLEEVKNKDIESCNIRVASSYWSGASRMDNLTKRISALSMNNNCSINLILDPKNDINEGLVDPDPTVYPDTDITISNAKMHSKIMIISIIENLGESHKQTQYVLTGSHNFTGPSLLRHDETLLVIKDDKSLYDAYLNNWKQIYCDNTAEISDTGTPNYSNHNSNAATFNNDSEYANGEWVELINKNEECISMANYSINDESGNIYDFDDVLLLPNEKLRILSGSEAEDLPSVKTEGEAEIDNMTTIIHADFGNAVWTNLGDTLTLNHEGEEVFSVELNNTDSADCARDHGGILETGTPSLYSFNANAPGNDSHVDYANGEWIEFINDNDQCISLDGYVLEDEASFTSDDRDDIKRYYNFPNVILKPDQKIRILSGTEGYPVNGGLDGADLSEYANFRLDQEGYNNLSEPVLGSGSSDEDRYLRKGGLGIWGNEGDTIYLSKDNVLIMSETY